MRRNKGLEYSLHTLLISACLCCAARNFWLLFKGLGTGAPSTPLPLHHTAADSVRGTLYLARYARHLKQHDTSAKQEQPLALQVRLNTGAYMPLVGFGTAALGEGTAAAVEAALRTGYTLLDSAQAREWYREDLVGQAVRQSSIPRERLFLTSKLHPRHLGFNLTLSQFQQSLADLQTPYMDLFLLHYPRCWPSLCPGGDLQGTWWDSWRALELLQAQGVARAIGVSNFGVEELEELLAFAKVKPAVVQSRSDPLDSNAALRELCAKAGVQFQGYSTLGSQWSFGSAKGNPVLSHPVLRKIAERRGKSAAQVTLRWALQTGQAVVPRSSQAAHMAANRDLAFQLSEEDMAELNALDGTDPWPTTSQQ